MPLALQSNALTTLANLKGELGILLADTSLDDVLTRMINGASDTIEKYCDRQFGYDSARHEKVAGYGTELIHLDLAPLWQLTSITIDAVLQTLTDFKIRSAEAGSIYSGLVFPDTSPIENSVSPHRRVGFEDQTIEVVFAGGYALPAASRLASDCPAWAATTVYATAGLKVTKGDRVYIVVTPGTSGSSGPSGMGTAIADGSVVWDFLSPAWPLPTDLEEACLQLAVFRYRRRGRDLGLTSEQIGRTMRAWGGSSTGTDGIPKAVRDVLDGYMRAR